CFLLFVISILFFFFFFQAEDGIRDGHVTGVQTCALPISVTRYISDPVGMTGMRLEVEMYLVTVQSTAAQNLRKSVERARYRPARSEERRVGKEWRSRGGREQ